MGTLLKKMGNFKILAKGSAPNEVSNGSIAYDSEGQENTILFLWLFWQYFVLTQNFRNLGCLIFVVFKLENQDNPDKIKTVDKYAKMYATYTGVSLFGTDRVQVPLSRSHTGLEFLHV